MKKFLIFFLINFVFNLHFSQNIERFQIQDSLKEKSFKYLEAAFKGNLKKMPSKAEIYANCILLKGKSENNESKIADGYLCLFKSTSNLTYLNSLIEFGKSKQNFENISIGYLKKGNYYYSSSKYLNALANYLLARNFSENNSSRYNTINFNIGLLKLELENYVEAQKLFLNYKNYLENNDMTNRIDYVSCIYAIASINSKINNLNVSDSYVKLGIEKAVKIDNKENYSNLLLVSGLNQYKRQNYSKSIEILKKVSKLFQDNSYDTQNLALSEFYIGMNLYKCNDEDFVEKFKKVDQVIFKNKNANRELIYLYPILIDHYKKINNKEEQLYYIEHLLTVSEIVNNSERNLSKKINKEFDTPILLKDREKLISQLNFKNSLSYFIIGGFTIFSVLLLIIFFKSRKKIKYYDKQAIILTKSSEQTISPQISIFNEIETKESRPINLKSTLSDEILDFISHKLGHFEQNKDFLNKSMTLEKLAKNFDTNRDYLSKSIRELEDKSYSQYVNDLRIKFITEELKINPKLQKLTIAAIGEKAGFNNAESFSNAFKKVTKTLPSYYIKALKAKI